MTNDRKLNRKSAYLKVAAEREQFGQLFNIDEYTIISRISQLLTMFWYIYQEKP